MIDANSLILFMKIADLGSFSAVAKDQKLAKSIVSQRISALEAQLNVRLLNRTTRKVSLTEDGFNLLPMARSIAESLSDVLAYSDQRETEPSGHIRVTSPHDIGYLLTQKFLPEFLAAHPRIDVELMFTSQYLDLVQENVDLAIRASSQSFPDSSLVRRLVYSSRLCLYASPRLKAHEKISAVEDLKRWPLIERPGWQLMHYSDASRGHPVKTSSARIFCNDMYAAMLAAKAGQGLALLPVFLAHPEVRSHTLVPILADENFGQGSFYVVYPSRRQLARKTKVFTEHLEQFLANFTP